MGRRHHTGRTRKKENDKILVPWEESEPYQDLRWCYFGEHWLPLHDENGNLNFYLDCRQLDGLSYRCRKCDNRYRNMKRQRVEFKKMQREISAESNPE